MTASGSRAPGVTREAKRVLARLVGFSAIAAAVLVAVAIVATAALQSDTAAAELRASIVAINEARGALSGQPEADASAERADAALAEVQDVLRDAADVRRDLPLSLVWLLCVVGAMAVWAACAYLYVSVVRPFSRLEAFAGAVAQGDLDMPLAYERSNPFGRFTWAFDNMRKEIQRARAAEAQAVEQTKTTIAALSHDIKTPIASIRAYSEALEMGLARDEGERAGYARVIARKCDEVTELTDDLFLHALADLDRIEVSCENAPIERAIRQMAADFDADGTVVLERLDGAVVAHDPKRLVEVLENLVANARKYAPGSPIEVSGCAEGGCYRIGIRDFGDGIAPEDLPFVLDRFYRGANAKDTPGAGLGLFIVGYLVEQMGGTVHLENADPGLYVAIEFPAHPLRTP